MSHRSSHRKRIVLWAVLGLFFGLAVHLPYTDGPNATPLVVVIQNTRPGGVQRLSVSSFGREFVTRTSANVADFDTEIAFWQLFFPAVFMASGSVFGGMVGYAISRWLPPCGSRSALPRG